jgi:D-methionine transport system ATP-binding protein
MIKLDGVHKTYQSDTGTIEAIAPTTLQIESGEIFGIIGRRGAGKSTLLRLINQLEQPSGGSVSVDGHAMSAVAGREPRSARNSVEAILPSCSLVQDRTAIAHLALALEAEGVPAEEARQRAAECLRCVGLLDQSSAYPAQLSASERQRVAIARALASNPAVLLCDEPTFGLDQHETESVLSTLRDVNRELAVTIVIVTHALDVVRSICDAVAIMEDGRVVEQLRLGDILAAPRTALGRRLFAGQAQALAPQLGSGVDRRAHACGPTSTVCRSGGESAGWPRAFF